MRPSASRVGPLERLLFIKTMPGFRVLPPQGLAAIAQHAEEHEYRGGDVILPADRPNDAVHLLVEGSAWTEYNGRRALRVEPPSGVGFLGVLSRKTEGVACIAAEPVVTLRIGADALFDIMEAYPELALAGLRGMSSQLLELRGGLPSAERDLPRPAPESYPERSLDFVSRLVALTDSAVFVDANLDAIAGLAERVTELRFEPGEVLWKRGEPSTFGYTTIWGVIRCTGEGDESWCETGEKFGLGFLDAMAGAPRTYGAEAVTRVVGLQGNIETFLDTLVEEHLLLQDMLAWQASALLDAYTMGAGATGDGEAAGEGPVAKGPVAS